MTMSKRERYIAIGAGVVIFALLLDQVLLSPMFKRLSDANLAIEDYQSSLREANNLFDSDIAASRRWKELAGTGLKADASAAEGQLLDRVREAAQNAGLSVQSLKPDRSERVNGFYRITLRVSATGSMSRMTRFLHNLQTSKIPLRMSDLQVSARKEGTDDLALQLGVSTIFDAPPPPRVAVAHGVAREAREALR